MFEEQPIPREHYMGIIRESRGSGFVKILTGIRGCGKSTLLRMFADELAREGVPEDMMFSADLEGVGSGMENYGDIVSAAESGLRCVYGSYVFLDEVQNVPEWEKAVSTLRMRGADVYITASDSEVIPSEQDVRLSGRCTEIRVQPLMFSEYVSFRRSADRETLLEEYLEYGGFPSVALATDRLPSLTKGILDGIFFGVLAKDVAGRHEIRGNKIDRLCTYLMENIGDRTSIRGAAAYMTAKGMKTQPITLEQYVGYLEAANLFSRSRRFDSKTGKYLRTSDKFYAADPGLRNRRVPFDREDLNGIVENVVYNELVYRFGNAAVCSAGQYEVDFVADPLGSPSYYQVAADINDPETLTKELRPLKAVGDNRPKTVITYCRPPADDVDGIRIVSLLDWLSEGIRERTNPESKNRSDEER